MIVRNFTLLILIKDSSRTSSSRYSDLYMYVHLHCDPNVLDRHHHLLGGAHPIGIMNRWLSSTQIFYQDLRLHLFGLKIRLYIAYPLLQHINAPKSRKVFFLQLRRQGDRRINFFVPPLPLLQKKMCHTTKTSQKRNICHFTSNYLQTSTSHRSLEAINRHFVKHHATHCCHPHY